MRPLRALALMALLGVAGAWLTSDPEATAPADRSAPSLTARPATTTTTAPATTTAPEPPMRPVRASRHAGAPRAPQFPPEAPQAELGDCGAWGFKSRARSDECWGPLIASYGDWPTQRMLAILYCESKGNPWVVNSSNHVGLLQIKDSNTKGDGPANIAHGHAMWLRSGTKPWRACGG